MKIINNNLFVELWRDNRYKQVNIKKITEDDLTTIKNNHSKQRLVEMIYWMSKRLK